MTVDHTLARSQLENARDRLIGVLSELRGIACDIECADHWVDHSASGTRSFAAGSAEQMSDALTHVVDLLNVNRINLQSLDRMEDG